MKRVALLIAALSLTLGAQQAGYGWPTYHGDNSGRHYSADTQISAANVHTLSLAWVEHANSSERGAIIGGAVIEGAARAASQIQIGAGRGGRGGGAAPVTIKSAVLLDEGVLYFTSPNNVFAVDARTGKSVWHYLWQGRSAIGNRGVGLYKDWLYLETPDNHIVSLDRLTGQQRWSQPIAPNGAANFSTSAPVAIGGHIIVGVGGDAGTNAGWVEAIDPATGDLQWKWNVEPGPGEPGFDTWPNARAAANGAGGPWQPVTYDPALNLVYVTTGNPTPTYNGLGRKGANLYTCSVVALNPDTGKMAWYYQVSPHDTHDWDATETPVLIDASYHGQPRKLLALAERNGYYFLLDRTNGHPLTVTKLVPTADGYAGLDAHQVLIPEPKREGSIGGTIASPDSDGVTNYPAPSYDPQTGLFYVNVTSSYSLYYLSPDPADATGFRGSEYHLGLFDSALLALHLDTGTVAWRHDYPQEAGFASSTHPGILTTAGGVLFTGDPSGNFVARDARTGRDLWHVNLGSGITDNPETYRLDGHQYILVAAGDSLYTFRLQ
ncbi:MAG TPA: PQQ-binding-like beta-propeller repeat protein [Terriglobales bacterium]|jgi:alcohol dehydrogenase (cytochrome c)